MIQVIDNFLSAREYRELVKEVLTDGKFTLTIITKNSTSRQMTNVISIDTPSRIMTTLLTKLGCTEVHRIKCNIRFPAPDSRDTIHIDIQPTGNTIVDNKNKYAKSAVLGLTADDGYTLFEDGTKSYSKENRITIFDSNKEHRAVFDSRCYKYRAILNIVYFK